MSPGLGVTPATCFSPIFGWRDVRALPEQDHDAEGGHPRATKTCRARRLGIGGCGPSRCADRSSPAQTDPAPLTVTATSDHCTGGLPVVDYTVANQTSTPVSVQTWWVADASVYGTAARHDLGPAPHAATGSFSLPFGFYATVTGVRHLAGRQGHDQRLLGDPSGRLRRLPANDHHPRAPHHHDHPDRRWPRQREWQWEWQRPTGRLTTTR